MFLAIEEMKQNKLRYGLILGLLVLVAYLVFFLTGLAYGLMQQNRSAVDKWQADTIFLSTEANKLLAPSIIDEALVDQVKAEEKASLFFRSGVAWAEKNQVSNEDKERVAVFGVDASTFLMPSIIEGRGFEKENEAVVALELLEELGLSIGDQLALGESEKELTVVGTTNRATYSVAPVLYLSQETFKNIYQKGQPMNLASAIVVRGEVTSYPEDSLEQLDIPAFIDKLPGYTAQNLTFAFMIGFLVVIAAVVIGIFIFVLTTQKAAIFGLMKIQGLSTPYIANSVLGQTLILAGLGTGIGLGLTLLSSLVLPSAVPFEHNWLFYSGISGGLILFALLGALFSVGAIVKVDPLEHIG
ncbi:FtsX-like permease family protein [Streptococcus sp. E24BD]|uniref:FtsX-like permease family protein n=1 Tax=Streptococcus sp. E24BD TaxID=3278715 RepID=UPI00359D44C3